MLVPRCFQIDHPNSASIKELVAEDIVNFHSEPKLVIIVEGTFLNFNLDFAEIDVTLKSVID